MLVSERLSALSLALLLVFFIVCASQSILSPTYLLFPTISSKSTILLRLDSIRDFFLAMRDDRYRPASVSRRLCETFSRACSKPTTFHLPSLSFFTKPPFGLFCWIVSMMFRTIFDFVRFSVVSAYSLARFRMTD